MTTRRGVGVETTDRPAAAKVATVPTCSSSSIAAVVTMG
jgi:hypothetical protein